MSNGDNFPDLVAKNGEFRYMVVRIRYYCCPFARFRLKMTSEMFANGRFWAGDSRQGHTGIPENEKNPCFYRRGYDKWHIRVEKMPKVSSTLDPGFSPTDTDVVLPSIMGEQRTWCKGEIH